MPTEQLAIYETFAIFPFAILLMIQLGVMMYAVIAHWKKGVRVLWGVYLLAAALLPWLAIASMKIAVVFLTMVITFVIDAFAPRNWRATPLSKYWIYDIAVSRNWISGLRLLFIMLSTGLVFWLHNYPLP